MNFNMGQIIIDEDVIKAVPLSVLRSCLERHQRGDYGDWGDSAELVANLNDDTIYFNSGSVFSFYRAKDNNFLEVRTSLDDNTTFVRLNNDSLLIKLI